MREVEVSRLTDVIEKLCIEANEHLPEDVKCAIKTCRACEDGEIAKGILDNIIENFDIADNENVPICQDTGMAVIFLEIGQDVHLQGGSLEDAVNEGVRQGYVEGFYENPSSKILLFVKIQKIIHLRSFIIKLWKVRK